MIKLDVHLVYRVLCLLYHYIIYILIMSRFFLLWSYFYYTLKTPQQALSCSGCGAQCSQWCSLPAVVPAEVLLWAQGVSAVAMASSSRPSRSRRRGKKDPVRHSLNPEQLHHMELRHSLQQVGHDRERERERERHTHTRVHTHTHTDTQRGTQRHTHKTTTVYSR